MSAGEAQALVLELRRMGLSNAAIGREVGRNDRLIGYIANGDKPGNNLVDTLRAVVAKKGGQAVSVPEAPRRTTKGGAAAKVRRKTKWAAGRTVKIKRQAVKGGAKSIVARIAEAAAMGHHIALTIIFDKHAQLTQSDGTPIPSGGQEQEAELGHGGAGFPAEYVQRKAGGDIVGWAVAHLMAKNRLAAPAEPIGMELRVWEPRADQRSRASELTD